MGTTDQSGADLVERLSIEADIDVDLVPATLDLRVPGQWTATTPW
ncbi:Mab-21 family protein [Flavimobilis rhizosphaerae]|nr:Mab-21 family protein [Flavimobilis rhizosphaerae]